LQQEIADAADEAARVYEENTPMESREDSEVTAAMRAGAKARVQVFKGQWSKYSAVAHPKLGEQFLQEVSDPTCTTS
jgi:hypothetical protein